MAGELRSMLWRRSLASSAMQMAVSLTPSVRHLILNTTCDSRTVAAGGLLSARHLTEMKSASYVISYGSGPKLVARTVKVQCIQAYNASTILVVQPRRVYAGLESLCYKNELKFVWSGVM